MAEHLLDEADVCAASASSSHRVAEEMAGLALADLRRLDVLPMT